MPGVPLAMHAWPWKVANIRIWKGFFVCQLVDAHPGDAEKFIGFIRLDAPEARRIPDILKGCLFDEAKTLQHHFFSKRERIKPFSSRIVNLSLSSHQGLLGAFTGPIYRHGSRRWEIGR